MENIIHFFTKAGTVDPGQLFLILFIFAVVIQLFYYFFFYARISESPSVPAQKKTEPLSVIICARNEALNLAKNLPDICNQHYPSFEVVVVNDCSVDNTEEILITLSKKYKNLRFTTIVEDRKFSHGKKLALTIGIKSAKYEWLVMTDADCRPESPEWLASIARKIDDESSIVLGYGRYDYRKGLLNNYLRYDTAAIALQYLSFARAGMAYMGTGRNLAYRRSLFFAHKGFASHGHILSGDDDLFVNQAATTTNTRVMLAPESITLSEPKTSFSDWTRQKKRHLTTWKHYKMKHKWLLGGELFSRTLFYLMLVALLVSQPISLLILLLIGLRTLTLVTVQSLFFHRVGEKKLFLPIVIYDVLMPMINFGLTIANRLTPKRSQWK